MNSQIKNEMSWNSTNILNSTTEKDFLPNSAIKKMFKYLQYQDQCQILHGLWNVFETTIKTGSKRTSVRSTENLKSRIALIGLINIYVESGW